MALGVLNFSQKSDQDCLSISNILVGSASKLFYFSSWRTEFYGYGPEVTFFLLIENCSTGLVLHKIILRRNAQSRRKIRAKLFESSNSQRKGEISFGSSLRALLANARHCIYGSVNWGKYVYYDGSSLWSGKLYLLGRSMGELIRS